MSGVQTILTQQGPTNVSMPATEVYTIATEYVEAGRLDAADRLLGHILGASPRQAEALHLRGLIAFRRGRLTEAAELMEQALRFGAVKSLHLRNISEVYRQLARLDEAAQAARRATAMDPTDALGPFNLAMVEYDRLNMNESIAAARLSLARKADLPEAHMKLGQALLATGDLADGWEHYEWRYKIPGAAPLMPATDRKQWDGTPLPEDRLLLIGDQGYGDVIMFGRYIAWAQARCAKVTVACSPEMRSVVEQLAPGAEIATRWDDCPPYAAFCPLSGLPRLAGIRIADLPGTVDYLKADPEKVELWKARLDSALPAGGRRVALAWAGRPTHNNDRNRSITLSQLAPLAAVPGVSFVSLQKGPAAAQCANWVGAAPLLNLDNIIESFDDSAAILANVDLLISVDTSMVHLAGAMGRPVWAMLPYAPDWRWLLGREDTPWYPSVRLFRQPRPRDWNGVIAQVAAAL
jgi:tetratricopeptide (TPR) repeat protein